MRQQKVLLAEAQPRDMLIFPLKCCSPSSPRQARRPVSPSLAKPQEAGRGIPRSGNTHDNLWGLELEERLVWGPGLGMWTFEKDLYKNTSHENITDHFPCMSSSLESSHELPARGAGGVLPTQCGWQLGAWPEAAAVTAQTEGLAGGRWAAPRGEPAPGLCHSKSMEPLGPKPAQSTRNTGRARIQKEAHLTIVYIFNSFESCKQTAE